MKTKNIFYSQQFVTKARDGQKSPNPALEKVISRRSAFLNLANIYNCKSVCNRNKPTKDYSYKFVVFYFFFLFIVLAITPLAIL